MKKNISIALMSLAVVGLTSCNMDAPSQSSMTNEEVYGTPQLADNAVMATLDVFGYNNGLRNRIMRFGSLNTDVEWYNTPSLEASAKSTANQNVADYATSPSNSNLNTSTQTGNNANNYFEQMYVAIERANTNISGLREYGEDSEELQQLLGESLVQRAVFYMELTKLYGDVPARWTITTSDQIYLPRSSSEVIYNQLLKDLEEAIELLPWSGDADAKYATSTIRMGKDFAKGLRARVALYAAGYGLHDNNGTADYRLNQLADYTREDLYKIAYNECADVIKHSKSKGVKLESIDYAGIWKDACQGIETLNRESMWEIPFISGRGQLLYAYAVKHENPNTYVSRSNGGQVGPTPSFYYSYDSNDKRRDVTCVPYIWDKNSAQKMGKVTALCFGKVRYEYMPSDLWPVGQDDGVNPIYMRLADVYMMGAEAANELGYDTDAKTWITPILVRAYGNSDKLNSVTDKTSMFNLIVDERGKEFAGEMLRKYDLIRWGNIDEKLAAAKAEMKKMQKMEAPYNNLPTKVWYKTMSDGNLDIYGLNFGDNDTDGKKKEDLGYTGTKWLWDSTENASTITDDIIDGLYYKQPSTHCVWPITQCVIDANGSYLNNDFLK